MVTLIGSLAAVLTTVCWLPQVVKTVRIGEANDFAWPYLGMLLVGVSAWTTYGILRRDVPISLCNSLTGLLVLMVVAVKVRGGKTRAPEAISEAP
ncbi:MAG TPA: PQ-loop domain-containing transporter [Acidimicrobiales bacterium]|nr:PQ-loop domain-containing transporter [Acidimicrobiales bacterium]